MSSAEIIRSTNLIILLEDEIFADFFNTFLSLPVFGQTPFYTVENSQWSLWPEMPCNLIAKYKGLLTWLEKYRLHFFCKTNLCFHYILCQEFISFIKSPEGEARVSLLKSNWWWCWRDFQEDDEIGSTRNLFPHLDNNCTGRICMICSVPGMMSFW
ncbi:RGSL1 isoform 9, partial [Pongo abelii]